MVELYIARIVILGIKEDVESVIVNGNPYMDWEYSNGGLFVKNLGLSIIMITLKYFSTRSKMIIES